MSVREGLEFETDIESDTINLDSITINLIKKYGDRIHLLRDPTRGGLGTVLNEICKQTRLGSFLEESKLPVDPRVEAACELLGLDPLYVANEGIFVAIVDSDISSWILDDLRSDPKGKNASIIGKMVSDHPEKWF